MMSIVSLFQNIVNYFNSSSAIVQTDDYSDRFYAGGNDDVQKDVKRFDVKGIVTFIDGNKNGRIDGYINFDNSSIITFQCKEKKVSIGSEVIIDIVRNSKVSPWYASKMEVLNCPNVNVSEDWDEIENSKSLKNVEKIENLPQKQVGMITYSFNDDLTLNNEINFRQRDCGQNSFRPLKGDWVIVQFDHSIDYYRVVGITPLRYVDFEGRVSSFDHAVGYVDKEILFSKSIIKNQHLKRGTFVYGTAIESVQGRRCNFRALTIFPKTHPTSNIGLKMRLKTMNKIENNIINSHSIGVHLSTTKLDFGEQSIDKTITKSLKLSNDSDIPVFFSAIKFFSETNNQFLISGLESNELEIDKNSSKTISITCQPQFPGLDSQKLIIECKAGKILVDVSVYVFDPVSNGVVSTKTDEKNEEQEKKLKEYLDNDFIPGIHLSAAAPVKLRSMITRVYPHKLKLYPIPAALVTMIEAGQDPKQTYSVLSQKQLGPGNYRDKMDLLVHLEEIQAKIEMKQFVLDGVRLIQRRDSFGIEVPGLSEGRPSLMVGDKVLVKVGGSLNASFSGSIEDILSDVIFVKFHQALHSCYTNEQCTVSFEHSRLPFRRMHLGIEVACSTLGDGIIFPGGISTPRAPRCPSQCLRLSRNGQHELSALNFSASTSTKLLELTFYNQTLNELQRVAVLRILHGYSRPLPYILFGPPGTGKTVTLVEAILQVYKNVASSRLLICAPSNSAADLLCLRLDESGVIGTGEMVRMNAYRRSILSEISDKEPIPPRVLPYCKSIDELSEIAMHRIIICTCISSGALYRLGLKPGHISHVFVDEAGQASEPEIMVALGLASPQSGQIVLAGDPMQLGPVIRSPHAQALQESYLHRLLLSSALYAKQEALCPGSQTYYDPLLVTQLLHNYRAHPDLLKLPSDMFYDGTLIPCADRTRFVNWRWLPNPQVPLVFNAVRGKELRHHNSPSTYNPSEAVMVVRWIGRLLQDTEGIGKIEHANISVITPYRAQVDCIRKLIKSCLDDVNLAKLKVASVEEFQGQENEVIIISTVRSSLDDSGPMGGIHESFAIVNTVSSRLGFLSNKRRFNVSITRACSLLIVVGDPALLQYDECWSKLISYSRAKGAYMGTEM